LIGLGTGVAGAVKGFNQRRNEKKRARLGGSLQSQAMEVSDDSIEKTWGERLFAAQNPSIRDNISGNYGEEGGFDFGGESVDKGMNIKGKKPRKRARYRSSGGTSMGLFEFFDKDAFKAKWTKELLKTVKKGGILGGKGKDGSVAGGFLSAMFIRKIGAVTLGLLTGTMAVIIAGVLAALAGSALWTYFYDDIKQGIKEKLGVGETTAKVATDSIGVGAPMALGLNAPAIAQDMWKGSTTGEKAMAAATGPMGLVTSAISKLFRKDEPVLEGGGPTILNAQDEIVKTKDETEAGGFFSKAFDRLTDGLKEMGESMKQGYAPEKGASVNVTQVVQVPYKDRDSLGDRMNQAQINFGGM